MNNCSKCDRYKNAVLYSAGVLDCFHEHFFRLALDQGIEGKITFNVIEGELVTSKPELLITKEDLEHIIKIFP